MLTSFALQAFNRVLRSNEWALQRLRAHAGRTIRIVTPPLSATVEVQPGGEIDRPRDPATPPDVEIHVSPGVLLRLLGRDEAVWNEVGVTGDSELATVLHQIWQQLDWGVEEDLSHLVGDVAAHRIVRTATQVRETAGHAFQSMLRNATEYWTEERPVVALRRDIDSFAAEVDGLRDDVARLEKRIEALRASAPGRFGAEYAPNNTTPPSRAGE